MTTAVVDQRTAGIVSRGIAAVLDFLAVGVILVGAYIGLVLTRLILNSTAFSFPSPDPLFSSATAAGVSVLYLVACWCVSGRTVGAVVMGLRLVNRKSNRLGPLLALPRAITCVLFPIGLLWAVVDRRRRSLHDIVFRTRVVYSGK